MCVRVIPVSPLPRAIRQGAATTDRINHGAARIPNLTQANFLATVLIIYKLNTFTNQRIVAAKNASDGNGGLVLILNNTAETQGIQMQFNRSVANGFARSTNLGTQVGRWLCMAGIVDV